MNRHEGHGAERDERDGTSEPEGCATFAPLLEAFHQHALDPDTTRSVAKHATGCAACGAALERFAATDRLIAAAPMALPGPELRQQLAARIATTRADRSPRTSVPMPFERKTVVHDVNHDVNDEPWTASALPARQTHQSWQRMRVWLGTVAAVLVVALLVGTLLTRTHGMGVGSPAGNPTTTPAQSTQTKNPVDSQQYGGTFAKPAGTCNPASIQAHLPAHSHIFDLAMVSPNEGWAVGTIQDAQNYGPVNTLILHYKSCAWATVPTNFPNASLQSISMDSPTNGWAVGSAADGQGLALHYTGVAWQQETLSGNTSGPGALTTVHMLSADEGWFVVTHPKDSHGLLSESILHFMNGQLSAITAPFQITDYILPVAHNEAWIAGLSSDGDQKPVLYHYQMGHWTSVALPQGVVVDRLRMASPSDIWASAHINAPSHVGYDQTAVVLHYDGASWQQVTIGASGHPQFVQAFDHGTAWAFSLQNNLLAMDIISGAQYQNTGDWHAVRWPGDDLSMGFVSLGGTAIQRVSADEYWAIGWHQPSNGPVTTVLLYFASGVWHEYGR